jgi:hypothetical protein
MDLEHFVTARDMAARLAGDRAATLGCERRLRRRVQSAMRERLEDRRSMINLDGALQSMAYTTPSLSGSCLPLFAGVDHSADNAPNRSWSLSEEVVSGNVQRRAG